MAERSTPESATRTLSDHDFAVGAAERYFEDYVPGAARPGLARPGPGRPSPRAN